jgi:hypothetical protein
MSPRKPKPRTERGFRPRQVSVRTLRQNFLIVCEGERTEPNYFRAFPVATDVQVHIYGAADNTLNVVRKAMELRADGDYNQVWCVFDRDSFPAQHVNAALSLAQHEGIAVAFSNEAFELWYLLHFHYYNTGISRHAYSTILHRLLGHPYEKNSTTIYQELEGRQATALRNAATLLATYPNRHPVDDNPSTTVHLLVQELNKVRRT